MHCSLVFDCYLLGKLLSFIYLSITLKVHARYFCSHLTSINLNNLLNNIVNTHLHFYRCRQIKDESLYTKF